MTYTLALSPAEEALVEDCAARENLSVPDFLRRTVMEKIERRVQRPKARDEMTDAEFDAMMEQGMEDIRQGRVTSCKEAFSEVRKELGLNGAV